MMQYQRVENTREPQIGPKPMQRIPSKKVNKLIIKEFREGKNAYEYTTR